MNVGSLGGTWVRVAQRGHSRQGHSSGRTQRGFVGGATQWGWPGGGRKESVPQDIRWVQSGPLPEPLGR